MERPAVVKHKELEETNLAQPNDPRESEHPSSS